MRTEKDIENDLINWLVNDLEWEYVKLRNLQEMEENIIKHLSYINRGVLKGRMLERSEFADIQKAVRDISYAKANEAYAFSRLIQRGGVSVNSAFGTGLMNLKLISNTISDNCFQVAHQMRDNNTVRHTTDIYDVTLFINGFPMVQIELKNVNVEIMKAIDQISRYIQNGYNNYFRYLQLFVVSDEMTTRYFVNNNKTIDKEYIFQWASYDSANKKNVRLDDLNRFTHSFLSKENVYDMITKFIIIYGDNEQKEAKDNIVMRPYQVHAVRAVLDKLKKPILSNGYIFHTTGSGKTLTSWKCAQLAASMNNISKVIFLVDRKDLSIQTIDEFKSVSKTYNIDIADDDNIRTLLATFREKKLVVTTIQKFYRAIKFAQSEDGYEDFKEVFGPYQDKRVLFIIDECHRTQFGNMHKELKKYFSVSQYIGFTGTPIFNENRGSDGRTTSELFGEMLHRYSIEDAIRDGSVLGFAIDYHNTLKGSEKFKELDDSEKTTKLSINADEIKYNKERISNIVDRIYDIHWKKTSDRKYSALFAVDSIKALVRYYNEFKRHNETIEDEDKKLRVTAVFTVSECMDEELGETYSSSLKNIIEDYNKEYGTKCTDLDSFRIDIVRRLTAKNIPLDCKIDIVIVVGIFLTGFDNKWTNTLYVDKNLEYHGLLQAFSRTNRVESPTKTFGNIVCFRPLKENVDKAIALFSSEDGSMMTVSKDYTVCFDKLDKIIDDVLSKVPEDLHISSNEHSDKEKRDFVLSMRELNKSLTEVKQFVEFDWSQIENKLSKDTYNKLVGEYKNISDYLRYSEEKESILDYIDFCMELIETDKINAEYIKNLINNLDTSSKEGITKGINKINNLIEKSNNDSIRLKKDIIKRFLEELAVTYESGIVKNAEDIEREFRRYVHNEKHKELKEIANESNISVDKIKEQVESFEIAEKLDKGAIRKLVKDNNKNMRLMQVTSLTRKLQSGIKRVVDRFTGFF